jgi:citrate synthase
MSISAPKGLQDVVANESSICFIDGARGILSYRGIDIRELAQKSTFEETTYLLWNGKLPTASELKQFSQQLAAARTLPPQVIDFLRRLPNTASPWKSCAPPSHSSPALRQMRTPRPTQPTWSRASISPRRFR